MGDTSKESSKKRRRRKRTKQDSEVDEDAASDNPNDGNDNTDVAADDIPDKDDSTKENNNNDDGNGDDDDVALEGEEGEKDDNTKKRKRKRKRNKKSAQDTNENTDGSKGANTNDGDASKLTSTEHTVFIEGLPFTSTEEDVRSFFTTHGCNDILQLRLPKWQDSGRLRGFGHVVFQSLDTKNRALGEEVNGKEIGARYISISEAKAPRPGTTAGASLGGGGGAVRDQPEGCKTVHVRNLPYEGTEEQIMEAFRVCGKILDGGVRIARNHINGQSKGFAYVEYKNMEGALSAVQKAAKPFGLTVLGRPVFVDYDEGHMKGSFRGGDGKLWSKEHGSDGKTGGGAGRGRGGGRGGAGRGRGFGMGRGPR